MNVGNFHIIAYRDISDLGVMQVGILFSLCSGPPSTCRQYEILFEGLDHVVHYIQSMNAPPLTR